MFSYSKTQIILKQHNFYSSINESKKNKNNCLQGKGYNDNPRKMKWELGFTDQYELFGIELYYNVQCC